MKCVNSIVMMTAGMLLSATSVAQPQWVSTTNLNPNLGPDAGAWLSTATGASGAQQVGTVTYSVYYGYAIPVAGVWNGSAGSWVNLSPGVTSAAHATNGTQQVGSRANQAALWSGTAASHVNLHPNVPEASAGVSTVFAISGSQQGGHVFQAFGYDWFSRASLWSGSAASWVNLHPAGGQTHSSVRGMAGTQQVGWTAWSGVHPERAALWHSTAASYISLHPIGSTYSEAFATNGTQQVGYFINSAFIQHAALWSGTADSVVSLNPTGATAARALGISGQYQVGWATIGGVQRAGLWSGTADSWVDLHELLPGGASQWRWSQANSVWTDGNIIRIAGYANALSGHDLAMLWEFENPLTLIPLPTGAGLAFAGLGVLAIRRRTRG